MINHGCNQGDREWEGEVICQQRGCSLNSNVQYIYSPLPIANDLSHVFADVGIAVHVVDHLSVHRRESLIRGEVTEDGFELYKRQSILVGRLISLGSRQRLCWFNGIGVFMFVPG